MGVAAVVAGLSALYNILVPVVRFIDDAAFRVDVLAGSFRNLESAAAGAKAALRGLPGVGGVLGAVIPGFQSGGVVPGPMGQPQLAVVHGGERITPASGQGRGGGSRTLHIQVMLDDKMVGEIIDRRVDTRFSRLWGSS